MSENIKVGIIIADDDEYLPFKNKIEKGEHKTFTFLKRKGHIFSIKNDNNSATVYTILSGVGKVNAAACAAHLVDIGCNIIFNYGLSGGISGISRGEICACTSFSEHDFDLTTIGYKPCEKPSQEYIYYSDEKLNNIFKDIIPNLKFGASVTGDSFICNDERRKFLRDYFNAMSCDMETAAIAYVCSFSSVPFASLRRISDNAGSDATESYREMNKEDETILSDYIIKAIKIILDTGFAGN